MCFSKSRIQSLFDKLAFPFFRSTRPAKLVEDLNPPRKKSLWRQCLSLCLWDRPIPGPENLCLVMDSNPCFSCDMVATIVLQPLGRKRYQCITKYVIVLMCFSKGRIQLRSRPNGPPANISMLQQYICFSQVRISPQRHFPKFSQSASTSTLARQPGRGRGTRRAKRGSGTRT